MFQRCSSGLAAFCVALALPSVGEEPVNRRLIYVLPEGFRGWACTEFGGLGPALPREGDALVIRVRPGEIVHTADVAGWSPQAFEVRIEGTDGSRKEPPEGVYLRRNGGTIESRTQKGHHCIFVGTEDEADGAGPPPTPQDRWPGLAQGVSADEREALLALFRATGGDHWTHRVGWLGPPGTECNWHGVSCDLRFEEPTTVTRLDLYSNNLSGPVPEELARLGHLEWLVLSDNHLSGRLPERILARWREGPLSIGADAPQLTAISEIDFEFSTVVYCAFRRVVLRADGTASQFRELCRTPEADDPHEYCEVREGRIWPTEFGKLGRLLEDRGFFALPEDYHRNITHGGSEVTRATRDGKVHRVSNYADAGPFDLWIMQRAIEGVAEADVEWMKTTTKSKCPPRP
jgi:hypothetical protein